MLLVHGEVVEGTLLLEQGIAACPYAAELRQLAADEFDFIRHATADKSHGGQVASTLDDLGQRIKRRRRELLESRRRAGDLPGSGRQCWGARGP
jgi:hypothetical protein